jgi:hypothetical protein
VKRQLQQVLIFEASVNEACQEKYEKRHISNPRAAYKNGKERKSMPTPPCPFSIETNIFPSQRKQWSRTPKKNRLSKGLSGEPQTPCIHSADLGTKSSARGDRREPSHRVGRSAATVAFCSDAWRWCFGHSATAPRHGHWTTAPKG